MRKSKFYLFAIALLLMAFPAFAQDNSEWSAYLFDTVNNNLVLVSSSGEPQTFSLGIPAGSFMYGMSISPDGSQIAYCYDYRPDPQAQGTMKLVVRDIDQEATLLEQDLGVQVGCSVTAFNGDILALSIVHPYDLMNPPAGKLWELLLIDPLSGEIIASLDNENPAMPAVAMFGQQSVPVLARVRELSRERVSFIAIPYVGSEGPAELPAFEWNVSEGTISELPAPFGYFNADFLPETGEVVYSVYDETMPAAMPAGPIPQANTVRVVDGDSEITIYRNSEFVITSTTFVNNGESVLVSLIPGFDAANPEAVSNGMSYVLVNRDGSVVEFSEEFNGAVFADAIPNGALFAFTPNPTGPEYDPTAILVLTSENIIALDSQVAVDYSTGWSPLSLVWTSPSPIASDISPFVGQ